jgi:hypothetical protein
MKLNVMRVHPATPTEKNPNVAVLAFYNDTQDITSIHRSLSHKGVSLFHVAERPMTIEEIDGQAKLARYLFYRYPTWVGLIQDEYEVTKDLKWCEQLHRHAGIREPLESCLTKQSIQPITTEQGRLF